MYIEMEKELVDYIMNQRNEAEEFSKQPGCWMGMMPHPEESVYWTERVPSGTLQEFKRIQLEEDAYYITADYTSKSYARSLDFSNWTDEKIEKHIERLCKND
jgi:hypothetical protein|tara:strand:+ start:239 stop:544 length:306 start_codon:yes stop_codon:yes gene_type:complete